ncbi:MAG: D-glycero-beta-D-manno-heptose 1-phosphate adenylyltransferase [Candidatus Cloacimonetes bacterium]|nr:D-glycero-beta-D-manno-heptose 1-phosphate adenylyltransferase [Candidatus Cloacimonadota bacterium]MCF7813562.1 D-glycero-beta-D-manno-heptose 1-phosphate adenylyltransferase [Candidatus Cloacimonadota bacterium]MCF7868193.1 D-glycero-beta-D-manno-heptose 1-phosphate adenylyltransferase [Candidatus Cloacimonadota bacterium]MCF7883643.1 D-glycero-beta-D-manno-heptose 1-phosphate adenylyltransferase [Candidatus Cloacimonadota bacterium]
MKTKTWKEVTELVQELKKKGKEIVFTNGCFDIIHAGHIQYLMDAKELGDVLIIGLNSDASVKRLKGESRPINNENDRSFVLSALSMVDYVVIFDQDTPYELINIIMPDFLVKGGDWKIKDIVGSEIVQASGGVVRSLPFNKGYSTTDIIEKMKNETI